MGMTEWEKLQRGEIYDDSDQDLFDRRFRAKKLFRAYNLTTDEETEKRKSLFEELFAKTGKNVWVEPNFHCEYGSNIEMEDNVYINFDCVILDCARVHIGAHSLLGLAHNISLKDAVMYAGEDFRGRQHDALVDARNTADLSGIVRDETKCQKSLQHVMEVLKPKNNFSIGDLFDFSEFSLSA